MNCAILLAAGSGTRMGDLVEDKILFPLLEKPVINYSISAFTKTHKFSRFVLFIVMNYKEKQLRKY